METVAFPTPPVKSILVALVFGTTSAFGAYSLIPVYPAPGGTTFSGLGSAGQQSGRTHFYSGFSETEYAGLAWSFISIQNPYHTSEGGSDGNMTFSAYDPLTGVMTWHSTSNAIWATAFGTQNVATRLVAQFQPFTGIASGPLLSGWIAPKIAADEGVAAAFGNDPAWPLIDVDETGAEHQFQVWYRFETAGGTPLLDYYDSSNHLGGSMQTGLTGAFLVQVPEPSSALLSILLGAGFVVRRKR